METTTQPLLDIIEARIVGCLIEKEKTTPEYYPLTLNSLTNACNQKSNRSPVMSLTEEDVAAALDMLVRKGIAQQLSLADSRVLKFKHLAYTTLTDDPHEIAVLCELLLRGAQTFGELRSRCERITSFDSLEHIQETVMRLVEREKPLVVALPRQPGQKELRYMHVLCGMPDITEASPLVERERTEPAFVVVRAEQQRIEELEQRVQRLEQSLQELQQAFLTFKQQFE